MGNFKIAISKNDNIFKHSTNWSDPWIKYCQDKELDYEVIDCYQPNAIEKLQNFDCLLWHFSNYSFQDMMMARSILNCAEKMGLIVFPDFKTAWHFDDKIAETYLLQTIGAPIPDSVMFYTYKDCLKWLKSDDVKFPIIAKLRCGSGSHNVKMLKSKSEVRKYAKKMFSKGLKSSPSLIYKASSNIKSAKTFEMFKNRLKRLPEFLNTLMNANKFPPEKQYVFFQEYIPNAGFDLKVVVIGEKLSFIARNIRKNDFRASGGGDLFFDRKLVSKNIIDSAFNATDKLGFQCMGYDYVVDKESKEGKIVEISYGFSHEALLKAGGYFDRLGQWHEEPLNIPNEIIKNILAHKK